MKISSAFNILYNYVNQDKLILNLGFRMLHFKFFVPISIELKIPISLEIKHLVFTILFDQFTRYFLLKHISKANKFSSIFYIQNKKKFFSEKMLVPESKLS